MRRNRGIIYAQGFFFVCYGLVIQKWKRFLKSAQITACCFQVFFQRVSLNQLKAIKSRQTFRSKLSETKIIISTKLNKVTTQIFKANSAYVLLTAYTCTQILCNRTCNLFLFYSSFKLYHCLIQYLLSHKFMFLAN